MNPFGVEDTRVKKSWLPSTGWREITRMDAGHRVLLRRAKPHHMAAGKYSPASKPNTNRLPTSAIFNGRKMRVAGQHSKDRFVLIDGDTRRIAHRSNVKFTKSYLGGGKWDSAVKVGAKALRNAGSHKSAVGATKKDTKIKNTVTQSVRAAREYAESPGGREIKVRGGKAVHRDTEYFGGSPTSLWSPTGSKGGQRKNKGLIIAGEDKTLSLGPKPKREAADTLKHESQHAGARKPMSRIVRFSRDSRKMWGEEARADAAMSPLGRRESGYRQVASSPKKVKRDFLKDNPELKRQVKAAPESRIKASQDQTYSGMNSGMYHTKSRKQNIKAYKNVSRKLGTWED